MKFAMTLAAIAFAALTGCASQPGASTHNQADHAQPAEPRSGAKPERPDERLALGVTEARVNGLSCPQCAESLSAVMKRLDGVESVRLDLGRGVVQMQIGKARPTRGEVASAIDAAGFTFVEFLENEGG